MGCLENDCSATPTRGGETKNTKEKLFLNFALPREKKRTMKKQGNDAKSQRMDANKKN